MTILWIIGAAAVDSLVGLAGVFSLLVSETLLKKTLKTLVAFSAGVLLGGGFFHLLAESLATLSILRAFTVALIGFLAFFILEEYLHWHHCEECGIHPYSYLMIWGDAAHNLLDGLVIAGTFMVDIRLGIVTTLIIIAHEVPQELGVFAVLVSGGFNKYRAIFFCFLAQCTCIIGAVLAYWFFGVMQSLSIFIVPFAAGGFIYIAAADLIPGMHKTEGVGKVYSFIWLCLGLGLMMAMKIYFKV